MTKEKRESGGVELAPDAVLGLSPFDREMYLDFAFASLPLTKMAELLSEYDPELARYLRSEAHIGHWYAGSPDLAADGEDDPEITWPDRHMYLEHALQELTRPEIVRLLRHCEPDLLHHLQLFTSDVL